MRSRRSYGSKQMTRPKAEHALATLLRDCRPEMLAGFTAARLSSLYNVAEPRCAEMLGEAIARREVA